MLVTLFGQQFSIKFWVVLVLLAAVGILLSLAQWQWQRSAEKQQRLALISSAQQQQQPLSFWLSQPAKLAQGVQAQVEIYHWLPAELWLDNQVVNKRLGKDYLRQAQTSAGMLWLNLGFLPSQVGETPSSPELPAPLTLNVTLKAIPNHFTLLLHEPEQSTDKVLSELTQVGLAARNLTTDANWLLMVDTPIAELQPHYQVLNMPPEKHQAYAWQWLLLALAVPVVGLWASRKTGEVS